MLLGFGNVCVTVILSLPASYSMLDARDEYRGCLCLMSVESMLVMLVAEASCGLARVCDLAIGMLQRSDWVRFTYGEDVSERVCNIYSLGIGKKM